MKDGELPNTASAPIAAPTENGDIVPTPAVADAQAEPTTPLIATTRIDDSADELEFFGLHAPALDDDSGDQTSAAQPGGDAHEEDTTSLLAIHREGAGVIDLEEALHIGRAPSADLSIDDSSLSRLHARFIRREGAIFVEDLGSTNGTLVNARRILEETKITARDDIRLGHISVALMSRGRAAHYAARLGRHDDLVGHAEYELCRCRHFAETFSLMLVQSDHPNGRPLSRWLPQVVDALRPIDQVAVYAPNALMLLFPGQSSEDARQMAAWLRNERLDDKAKLLFSLATFPADGRSVDALIEGCVHGIRRASTHMPIVCSDGALDSGRLHQPSRYEVADCSPAMRQVHKTVAQIAGTELTVLITGETGTGKEIIAREIHRRSPRADRPFVVVDCAGIPKELAESTLFGHERGSFTGASEKRRGLFEQADGGTVLLDELGELALDLQPKLLRILDRREVRRVGSTHTIAVNVRVIAATNQSLAAMVKAHTFRADLHYRLGDEPIRLPPLRQRPEDIEPLARRFLQEVPMNPAGKPIEISSDAFRQLKAYGWPGNIRELRNVVERAAAVASDRIIQLGDLPPRLRGRSLPYDDHEGGMDFKARVAQFERDLIEKALRKSDGNQTQAAEILRIPLRTLVFKLRHFNIPNTK